MLLAWKQREAAKLCLVALKIPAFSKLQDVKHAYSSIHLHTNFWPYSNLQDIFQKPFYIAIGTLPEANLIAVLIKPSKGPFFCK